MTNSGRVATILGLVGSALISAAPAVKILRDFAKIQPDFGKILSLPHDNIKVQFLDLGVEFLGNLEFFEDGGGFHLFPEEKLPNLDVDKMMQGATGGVAAIVELIRMGGCGGRNAEVEAYRARRASDENDMILQQQPHQSRPFAAIYLAHAKTPVPKSDPNFLRCGTEIKSFPCSLAPADQEVLKVLLPISI